MRMRKFVYRRAMFALSSYLSPSFAHEIALWRSGRGTAAHAQCCWLGRNHARSKRSITNALAVKQSVGARRRRAPTTVQGLETR